MQNRHLQKQTGAFYTPPALAQQLAREVLACLPPETNLKTLTVLDPAAGEGGLLLPFAQELADLPRPRNRTRRLCKLAARVDKELEKAQENQDKIG